MAEWWENLKFSPETGKLEEITVEPEPTAEAAALPTVPKPAPPAIPRAPQGAVTPQPTEGLAGKPMWKVLKGPGGELSEDEYVEFNDFLDGQAGLPTRRILHYEKKLGIAIAPNMGFSSEGQIDYRLAQIEDWAKARLEEGIVEPGEDAKPAEKLLFEINQEWQKRASPDEIAQRFSGRLIRQQAFMRGSEWGREDPKETREQSLKTKMGALTPVQIQAAEQFSGQAQEFEQYEREVAHQGPERVEKPGGYDEWRNLKDESREDFEKLKAEGVAKKARSQELVDPLEFDPYIRASQERGEKDIAYLYLRAKRLADAGKTRGEIVEALNVDRENLYSAQYTRAVVEKDLPPEPIDQSYLGAVFALAERERRTRDWEVTYDEADRGIKIRANPGAAMEEQKQDIRTQMARESRPIHEKTRQYVIEGGIGSDIKGFVNDLRVSATGSGGSPQWWATWNEVYKQSSLEEKQKMETDPLYSQSVVLRAEKERKKRVVFAQESLRDAQRAMVAGKDVRIMIELDGSVDTPTLQNSLTYWHLDRLSKKEYGEDFTYRKDKSKLSEEELSKITTMATAAAGRDLASAMAVGTGLFWVDPDPWASTEALAELPFVARIAASAIMPTSTHYFGPRAYMDEDEQRTPSSMQLTPRASEFKRPGALQGLDRLMITTISAGVLEHYRKELRMLTDEEFQDYQLDSSMFLPTYSFTEISERWKKLANNVDLALGISDTDPLRRKRQVTRLRQYKTYMEESGEMFGEWADALEVSPDVKTRMVQAGMLSGFAMEFTALGSDVLTPSMMALGKSVGSFNAWRKARNSAPKLMKKLATQVKQGKLTVSEADAILRKSHSYTADLVKGIAASDAKLFRDYLLSQEDLGRAAAAQWEKAKKAADDAGLMQMTSPYSLPGGGLTSKLDRDIWLSERARELQGTGIKPSAAKQLAREELAESMVKERQLINDSTQPFDVYRTFESTPEGDVLEHYFLRWEDEAGNPVWHKWLDRGTDGVLKPAGNRQLNGLPLKKAGRSLVTRQGNNYTYTARLVGDQVDAPLGGIRVNEITTFEGAVGRELRDLNLVTWNGWARPPSAAGRPSVEALKAGDLPPEILTPEVPRSGDVWYDWYEPGEVIYEPALQPKKVPAVKRVSLTKAEKKRIAKLAKTDLPAAEALRDQLKQRYQTVRGAVEEDVRAGIPFEPAEIGRERPIPARKKGDVYEQANRYHDARAEMLKTQLRAAEERAVAARELADQYESLEGPLYREYQQQNELLKKLDSEIAKLEKKLSEAEPAAAEAMMRLTVDQKKLDIYQKGWLEAKTQLENIEKAPVGKKGLKAKKQALEHAEGRLQTAEYLLREAIDHNEYVAYNVSRVLEHQNKLMDELSAASATRAKLSELLFGADGSLRAIRGGYQSDDLLRRLILAARKETDTAKRAKILKQWWKRRSELGEAATQGKLVQPGVSAHMPEALAKSGFSMKKALKGAAREAELHAKALRTAFNQAKKMAKKTEPGWEAAWIKEAVVTKRRAAVLEERSKAYWRALDKVADDARAGEIALKDLPEIDDKFVDILSRATLRKPLGGGAFRNLIRRALKRMPDTSTGGTYVIDPKVLIGDLNASWGPAAIKYITDLVEGTRGTRGGEASDILRRVIDEMDEGAAEVVLTLDEVSSLQDLNAYLKSAWMKSHEKHAQISTALALRHARNDVAGTFNKFDDTETKITKLVREAFATFDPIRAELGDVAESVHDVLKAVRHMRDHFDHELLNLGRHVDQTWPKVQKTHEFVDKAEYMQSVVFKYLDENAPLPLGIRAPILPAAVRPEVARSTWMNLGEESVWQQMRSQLLNDDRVLTTRERMDEYKQFLMEAETLVKTAQNAISRGEDWRPLIQSDDAVLKDVVTKFISDWEDLSPADRRRAKTMDDLKLLAKRYGEDPWATGDSDRSVGTMWALSRSLLPHRQTLSRQQDALLYGKALDILKSEEGRTAAGFHAALGKVYTGLTLNAFEKKSTLFNRFDAKYVADTRSVGALALAASHGAIVARANRLVTKAVGGFYTADEVRAANMILTDDWNKLKADDVSRGLAALAKPARPHAQTYVQGGKAHLKAVKRLTDLIQTGSDLSGRNFYMSRVLVQAIEDTMPNIVKELSQQYNRQRTVAGAFNAKSQMGALALWRASIVTGIIVPRPTFWTNNFWGDFSQIWMSHGFQQATHTSTQYIMGVPWWSKRLVEGRSWMAEKLGTGIEGVLPDLTTSLFNPHINNIFMGKPGHLRTKQGRVVSNHKVLRGAIDRGIFDTYVHEDTLSFFTKAAEDHPSWKSYNLFKSDWSRDISEMAVYTQQRQRFALYTNLIAKGYTEDVAAKMVLEALYDWKNGISQQEIMLMLHMVPFYRFWRLAMGQAFTAISEPLTRPSKALLAKAITGRSKLSRIHQQKVATENLPFLIDPDLAEDYSDRHEMWDAAARHFLPGWTGHRPIGYTHPNDAKRRTYYEHLRGLKNPQTHHFSTLGPFTALDTTGLMATWMNGIAAATISTAGWDFVGKGDLQAALVDDWRATAFDASATLLFPHQKRMIQGALNSVGVETGGYTSKMVRASGTEIWMAKNNMNIAGLGFSETDLVPGEDGKPMISATKAMMLRTAPVVLEFNQLMKIGVLENPDWRNSEGGMEYMAGSKFFLGKHMGLDQQYPYEAPEGRAAVVERRAGAINTARSKLKTQVQQWQDTVGREVMTPSEQREEKQRLERESEILEERGRE